MRVNLLFVCNETRVGGAERSLLELLDRLPGCGYHCFVVLPGPGEMYHRLRGKCEVRFFPMKKMRRGKGLLHLLAGLPGLIFVSARISLFAIRNGIKVVHANSIQAHFYTAFVGIFTFKPVVWHVRDNLRGSLIDTTLSLLCRRLICVSGFIYRQVDCAPGRKLVIHNGVVLCNGVSGSAAAAQGKDRPGLVIGNIGQMVAWKRHADLIYAAETVVRRHGNVTFVIAGFDGQPGNRSYVQSLKDLVKEKKLDGYFRFADHTDDITPLLQQLDFLVHCAIDEPFGRVIIEAMACGKPVIAYDSGGPAEIISPGRNGMLVEEGSIAELSAAIMQLIGSPDKRREWGENARRHVTAKFQSKNTAQRVSAVIAGCL